MPNKKNAKKHLRQSDRLFEHRNNIKQDVKFMIKKTRKAAEAKDQGKVDELMKKVTKAIDKASAKKIYKKNTAARKKSRLYAEVKRIMAK